MAKKSNAVWWWLLAGVGLMLAAGTGGVIVYENYKQRGIRNNNPGNIEFNPNIHWKGQIGQDGPYLIFDTPENGLRALALDLRNKMKRGLNSVSKIITVWAPPTENNTAAYIDAVSSQMGVGATDTLSTNDLPGLVASITHHENGIQPYPPETIQAGVNAALVA